MTAPEERTALARATALIDLARYDDAASQLATYLATDPHNSHALCLLARARVGLNDNAAAKSAAQAAIAANPNNEWAFRIASLVLQREGQFDGSVRMADSAINVAPHLPACHARLAIALSAGGGNLDRARAAADRAVQLNPHYVDGHLAVGAVALADGRRNDAKAAYERALAIDPTSAAAHNDLARLHLSRRRFGNGAGLALAADGFASALRSDPTLHVSRRNLDIVIHVFLGRLAYYVFLAAFVGSRISGSADVHRVALWIPSAALIVPGFFAIRFLIRLPHSLRHYLSRSFRAPLRGAAIAALATACISLLVGALITRLAEESFTTALVLSIAARIALYSERKRDGVIKTRIRKRRL